MDVVRAWHGREIYLCALTALPLGSCPKIKDNYKIRFIRHSLLFQQQYSQHELCITYRITTFSDTHFCFNNSTANKNSVSNTELLLSFCLHQGQHALLGEQVAILVARRRTPTYTEKKILLGASLA